MYGGYTYGGTNFGGTGSAGNFYTVVLTDEITTTDTFSKIVALHKTLTDSIISLSTITIAGIYRRTVSDVLTAVDTFSKLIGKLFTTDNIRVSSVIRRYLNGLIINPWIKVVKTVASFLKITKPTATYTKTTKPSVTGIWTKTDKPY